MVSISPGYEQLLVHAPIGFAFVDRECCFVHVNEKLSALHGIPREEHVGRSARELLPGLHELLDAEPKWCDGILGVMQLVVMAHVHQALRRRLR